MCFIDAYKEYIVRHGYGNRSIRSPEDRAKLKVVPMLTRVGPESDDHFLFLHVEVSVCGLARKLLLKARHTCVVLHVRTKLVWNVDLVRI
jgi:hypothetical protein